MDLATLVLGHQEELERISYLSALVRSGDLSPEFEVDLELD